MGNKISKIGPHVYVKGSTEAVKLYKEAFGLKGKGKPTFDESGHIYHHLLVKNDEFFISVSEDKYLQAALVKEHSNNARLVMSFTVAFENEDDLRKAFTLLYEDGNPSTGFIVEPSTAIYCDFVDKFGVNWCLFVPQNWNYSIVNK